MCPTSTHWLLISRPWSAGPLALSHLRWTLGALGPSITPIPYCNFVAALHRGMLGVGFVEASEEIPRKEGLQLRSMKRMEALRSRELDLCSWASFWIYCRGADIWVYRSFGSSRSQECGQGILECECITGWWFGSFFIFPYIRNVIIPTDSYFSKRLNHQPDHVMEKEEHHTGGFGMFS